MRPQTHKSPSIGWRYLMTTPSSVPSTRIHSTIARPSDSSLKLIELNRQLNMQIGEDAARAVSFLAAR